MKLFYWKGTNFGDDLNPFIFKKLLPNLLDDDMSTRFFGIGSILGDDLLNDHKDSKIVIFSSGYGGYFGPLTSLNALNIDVVCVRGPITARLLNLPSSKAITDGAILLKAFDFKSVPKIYKISFMPHWSSEARYPYEKLCNNLDIKYISPRSSVDQVISEILASELIVAEAMHGAIVADTLRVPWVAAQSYKNRYRVKWDDWTQSVGLTFKPLRLPQLWSDNDVSL